MTTKEILDRAQAAKAKMLTLTGEDKNNALLKMAEALVLDSEAILTVISQYYKVKDYIPQNIYLGFEMEEEQMELLEKQKQDTIAILQQAKVAQNIIDEINQTDLENYRKPYRDKILEYIEEENVKRLIQSVSSFNIDDLASMAESLISITNLQTSRFKQINEIF